VRSIAIVAVALLCGRLGSGQATSTSSTSAAATAAATKKAPATKSAAPVTSGKAPAAGKSTAPTTPKAAAPKSAAVAPGQKSAGKGTRVAKASTGVAKATTGVAKSGAGAAKAPAAGAAARTASNKKAAPLRTPPPRYYTQQQPMAERYREIQRALAERGYFQGAADGTWGSESIEALRRFQADQNLEVDGKLGSLSLIALGLGPRHDGAPVKPASVTERGEPESGVAPAEAVPDSTEPPQAAPAH